MQKIIHARTELKNESLAKNNQKICDLANTFRMSDNSLGQNFFDLMTLKKQEFLIASFNKNEISKYSEMLGCKIKDNATIGFRQDDFRHLIRSGHITGIKYDSKRVGRRLSYDDLLDIKRVIKKPDIVKKTYKNKKNGNLRLLFETKNPKRHRLIMEVAKNGKVSIVTYFNP